MILHWGSAQPSPCSDPCCSCASPQSITHKCHWELVQSPAKSWVGTAGGFTSSPRDCKFVNNWEVTMVYLFIYLKEKAHCHSLREWCLAVTWRWLCCGTEGPCTAPSSPAQHQPQPGTETSQGHQKLLVCNIAHLWGCFLRGCGGKEPQPSGQLWTARSMSCWGDTEFCLLQNSIFEQPFFSKPGVIILE